MSVSVMAAHTTQQQEPRRRPPDLELPLPLQQSSHSSSPAEAPVEAPAEVSTLAPVAEAPAEEAPTSDESSASCRPQPLRRLLSAAAAAELSTTEESAARAFLSVVNPWRSTRGYAPLPWRSAVKFLMARKFHVERALALYQQHELMRVREGLAALEVAAATAAEPPLADELAAGKFTILPTRDSNGATLALFSASRHDPQTSTHRATLQGVVYQLDVAMEDPATQRGGLVFIYNMHGSRYANFDYDLSQKMLTLLKGAYPARLKKVLIVTAPLWFKAPFKVLRLFVREKLRDRVFTVSIPQLQLHVPPEALPRELGGRLEYDHAVWLSHCAEVAVTCRDDGGNGNGRGVFVSQPATPEGGRNNQQPTLEQLETLPVKAGSLGGLADPDDENTLAIAQPPEDEDSLNSDVNGYEKEEEEGGTGAPVVISDDEAEALPADSVGMTLIEFIEHVRVKGRRGLYEEYAEIKNRPPAGTFHHSRAFDNQVKNRYTDVLCFDHSRVTLKDSARGDYINANFVDGYKQPRAFISAQGPLPKTFEDFWQMVWEQKVLVVVMTTRAVERHRTKCGQYWPEDVGTSLTVGPFTVRSEEIENCDDFVVTHLSLSMEGAPTRQVCHFQFVSWPDYGVPDSALSMLHFLQRVREKQAEMLAETAAVSEASSEEADPPIVVHCSAGIGRTGTFATLDIAIRKFEDVGRVDIQATVERIRAQRAFSIQMPDQYVFCHLAFLEYALNMGHVDEIDLTGFDDDCDSD